MKGQVRISWNINNKTGHGNWHDLSSRSKLFEWVMNLNSEYGQGTHWIEEDSTNPPCSNTRQ